MRLPHARELEIFVVLGAENKTECLRLEKGDLKIDKDLASSDRRCHYINIIEFTKYTSIEMPVARSLRTEIHGAEFTIYFCVTNVIPAKPPIYSQRYFDELLQSSCLFCLLI